jgi:crotonobetainyl-CoA:carnitine CoA-transferase CaiB-like acyl-CoA transferase
VKDESSPTPEALLQQLLSLARLTSDGSRADITGSDPAFATRFRLGTAGAAVVAATGVAAAHLWRLKTGRSQEVSVSVREGAAALRSDQYLRKGGSPPPNPWAPISGFYRTRDEGWIQLHCNFEHHRDGVLAILGCENDKQVVAEAIAKHDGRELEDRFNTAGLCTAFVRRPEEWLSGEQAKAIAKLPLFEIEKIGESLPEPLAEGSRPLSGVRVLDLTRVIAGPVGGRTLAEHGADVMRVTGPHLPGFPEGLDIDMGHGKLSAALDLRTAEDQATFDDLVEGTDVFLQSYRPGSMAARGFSPEEVAKRRPGIVYATLSAYGHVGPWRERRGFDSLTQSASGIVFEESVGGPPRHLPAQALDYVSGYLLALGMMAALGRRATEGGSYLVRVSLAQTGRWLQSIGRTPAEDIANGALDLSYEGVRDLLTERDTDFGRLSFLAPVVHMSETAPRWERPSVPLGSSPPVWPER